MGPRAPRQANWTPKETEKLLEAIEKYQRENPGKDFVWSIIHENADVQRTVDQCMNRWKAICNAKKKAKLNPNSTKSPWAFKQVKQNYLKLLKDNDIRGFFSSRKWTEQVIKKTRYSGTAKGFEKFAIKSLNETISQLSQENRDKLENYIDDIENWNLNPSHSSRKIISPADESEDEDINACPEDDEDENEVEEIELSRETSNEAGSSVVGSQEIEALIEGDSSMEESSNRLDDSGVADEILDDPPMRRVTYTNRMYGTEVSRYGFKHVWTPINNKGWQKCLEYVAICECPDLLLSEEGWNQIRSARMVDLESGMSDRMLMQAFFSQALPNRGSLVKNTTPDTLARVKYAIRMSIPQPTQQTHVFLFHSLLSEDEITNVPICAAIKEGILSQSGGYNEDKWLKEHLNVIKMQAKQNNYDYFGATKNELEKMKEKVVNYALKID